MAIDKELNKAVFKRIRGYKYVSTEEIRDSISNMRKSDKDIEDALVQLILKGKIERISGLNSFYYREKKRGE